MSKHLKTNSALESQRSTLILRQDQANHLKSFDCLLDEIGFNGGGMSMDFAAKSEHDTENNTWDDGLSGPHHTIPITDSFKKRKADESHEIKDVAEEEEEEETKGCQENSSSIESRITSDYCSKEHNKKRPCKKKSSKIGDDSKTDYIHVRARRGQATDSHSLAERVRREKISERMNFLQGLVPGCKKVTGKAGMLDEIINYVQSLQKQVEFLSMKLAAATTSMMDFDVDSGSLSKEGFLDSDLIGMFNFNPQEVYFDSTSFDHQQLLPWSHELQSMYSSGIDFQSL